MRRFIRKRKISTVIATIVIIVVCFLSCQKSGLLKPDNNITLLPKISAYNIFKGRLSDLVPTDSFKLYELSSQLFTNYAEKQRLIKLPAGTTMSAIDNGLLNFPDGTILVKTFFYYHDKRDTAKGKRVIETRLLIKSGALWNVGTYIWDDNQTEANLITTGLNTSVNWIDDSGTSKVISYHIPNNNECATCHNSNKTVIPIGPKLRNLNRDVVRNNIRHNQLQYFHKEGLLNSVNPSSFDPLPDYNNTALSLEKRARAYFEVNCAHCHNEKGFASDKKLYLGYEKKFEESNLQRYQDLIVLRMKQGRMPKLGTTIIHEEGLALIRAYVESLP